MSFSKILPLTFVLMIVFVFIGSFKKILHHSGADVFLAIGLLAMLLFTVIALYEVHSSKHINRIEKVMWIVGLLFGNSVTSIVYLLVGRKHVLGIKRPHIQQS